MRVVTINEAVSSREELHSLLKKKLEFPDYYGANLDALWDCLTAFIEIPLVIEWVDYDKVREMIGGYADQVARVMVKAQGEREGLFVVFR